MSEHSEFLLEGKFAGTQVSTRRNNVDKGPTLGNMIRTVYEMKLSLSEEYLSTFSCVMNELACLNYLGSCDGPYPPPGVVFGIPFTGTTITVDNASTARNVVVSSRR